MADDDFEQVIAAIYQAVLAPETWPDAVGLCGNFCGGFEAHMLTIDKRHNQTISAIMAGSEYQNKRCLDYQNYYVKIDPHLDILRHSAIHQWNCSHHTATADVVARSEFFQDFLIPCGQLYGLFAIVNDDQDTITTFSSVRAPDMTPFSEQQRQAAQRFSPHLQQALRIQGKMRGLNAQAELGTMAIDALALPMWIVTAEGRILHANSAAELKLASPSSVLQTVAGYLMACNPVDKSKLTSLIATATTFPAQTNGMLLTGEPSRQLFVTPLPAQSPFNRDWQRPLALVTMTEAGERLSPLELIGKIYSLTPAELRLAAGLLTGKSPEEYAEAAELTLNTIRSQLKSLFSKTGTHRQAQLVALISQVPPLK